MKISIAMATYNGAKFLGQQLQSFVDQTLHPDEIIITDDLSTDETEEIIREFSERAPFKVFYSRNSERLGYCQNFNAALMKTTGDIVFLSDQDDVWFPEKIEHMVALAKYHKDALVLMNDARLTDEKLIELKLTKLGQIISAGIPLDSFVMGCCCAIRRELLSFCLPIPYGLRGHDNWLVRVADALDAKHVDKTILQYYRRHDSNQSEFIANKTTKLSRHLLVMRTLKRVFDGNAQKDEEFQFRQRTIFIQGMRDLMGIAPKKYRLKLSHFIDKIEKDLEEVKHRMNLRRKCFVPRCFAVMMFLIEGGYCGPYRFKALIRDLLGH